RRAIRMIRMRPMSASGERENCRMNCSPGRNFAETGIACTSLSLKSNTWIEQPVGDIDDEIDDDEHDDHKHEIGHDHGAIERGDAVDDDVSDAGPGKNSFGDNRKSDRLTDIEPDDGHDRYHDILEDVNAEYAPW